jgi:hypothetical protein
LGPAAASRKETAEGSQPIFASSNEGQQSAEKVPATAQEQRISTSPARDIIEAPINTFLIIIVYMP